MFPAGEISKNWTADQYGRRRARLRGQSRHVLIHIVLLSDWIET